MKKSVQAVLINSNKEILSVSRKNDHYDFGLPGGKVEDDETLYDAMARELKEETGITMLDINPQIILSMHKDGYMGYTFLIEEWEGEIETDEPHVVKWLPIDYAMRGSFGEWNDLVRRSLQDMGYDLKREPQAAC